MDEVKTDIVAKKLAELLESEGCMLQKKLICNFDEKGIPHFDAIVNVVEKPVVEKTTLDEMLEPTGDVAQ